MLEPHSDSFTIFYRSHLSKILTVLLLLAFAACGEKKEVNDASGLISVESSYCPLGSLEDIELVEEAIALEKKLIFSEYALAVPRALNADSPLILSHHNLKNQLNKFKALAGGELDPKETTLWRQFKGDLLRWRDYQCSLDMLREKKDIDLRLLVEKEKVEEAEAIRLCKPFERGVRCEASLNLYQRGRREQIFVNHYQERYKKLAFKKLFKLKPEHKIRFQCQNFLSGPETLMTLKIKAPADWDEVLKANVKSYVETTWQKAGEFAIMVNWASDERADVFIEPTDKSLSFVSDDDFNTIHLSKYIRPPQIPLVVAHELGHVLGLPDCYVEYYDPQLASIIYYEPGREHKENIMCSMSWGNRPAADALLQIKTKKCLF